MQITSISSNSPDFPDRLKRVKPKVRNINILGTLPKEDIMVAIVGSRTPSEYGRKVTYQFASQLAKAGAVIVSGLAYGVDSIAHEAALDAGGKTVAVLGGGFSDIYPAAHKPLAKRILGTGGALVSEYEVDEPCLPHQFVLRNRIIAALSLGVIVTEAAAKSGSLFTARDAHDLSRQVMAIPGPITSPLSAGTNQLIASKNAVPITSASDAIVALGFHAREPIPVPAQSKDEALILTLMEKGASNSEDLIEQSQLGAAQFANIITLMEITGKVRNLGAGNWVVR
jgi:DNA processing protein